MKVQSDSEFLAAQFGDLLEYMPDAIVVTNLTGHIVTATNLAETLFGYARGELRGRLVETLLPPRFRGGHIGHRSNYVSQPRTRVMGSGIALFGLRKDGSEFPVEISLSPLKIEEVSLVLTAIRDITERKRGEKALQELSRRNEVLLREMQLQVTETAQYHEKTVAMNEALLLGSLRQHELTEVADSLNVQLQREITERKQAEQRQLLLTDELAHRGKNLLAVVLSIASRSLSGTRPLAEARDVLIQRLHALARSQSLLISEGFEGAPLEEVVRLEFESFSDRVKAVGPHVMLNPRVAQTFALVVHELSTNAAKYGALSRPNGQIAIHWSTKGVGAEARFKFQWQEIDGPPVVPPTHQGFGRTLLEKAAAQEFGGPPMIRFAPKGLIYEIDAPLSVVAAATSQGGRNS